MIKQPTTEEIRQATEHCDRNYLVNPYGSLFVHAQPEEIAAFEQTAAGFIAIHWPLLLAAAIREHRRKQRRREAKAAKAARRGAAHRRIRRDRLIQSLLLKKGKLP